MTRKRFCRKLMAMGASRNKANLRALALGQGQSYEEAYPMATVDADSGFYGMSMRQWMRAAEKLGRAWIAATPPAEQLADALVDALVVASARAGITI